LSLENIVLTAEDNCALIDLGMCLYMPPPSPTGAPTLIAGQPACGKLGWVFPSPLSPFAL
jgi:hypothetical protein